MKVYNVFDINGKFLFRATRNEICCKINAKYNAIRSAILRKGIYDCSYYITDKNYFDYKNFDYFYTEDRCLKYPLHEMIGKIKITP